MCIANEENKRAMALREQKTFVLSKKALNIVPNEFIYPSTIPFRQENSSLQRIRLKLKHICKINKPFLLRYCVRA